MLHHAEENKDFSSELIRKIEEAVVGSLNKSRSSKIAYRLVVFLGFDIMSLVWGMHTTVLLFYFN